MQTTSNEIKVKVLWCMHYCVPPTPATAQPRTLVLEYRKKLLRQRLCRIGMVNGEANILLPVLECRLGKGCRDF